MLHYEEILKLTGANSISSIDDHALTRDGSKLYWKALEGGFEGWLAYGCSGDTLTPDTDAELFTASSELNTPEAEGEAWGVVFQCILKIREKLGPNLCKVHIGLLGDPGYYYKSDGDHWAWVNVALYAKEI